MAPILDNPAPITPPPAAPSTSGGPGGLARALRWLALPVVVLLLVLVGLASTATDPRPTGGESDQTGGGSSSEGQPDYVGSDQYQGAEADLDPVTVTAETGSGDVDLTFETDGVIHLEGESGPEVELIPGVEGGFRLNEDGGLQPVPPSELGNDEIGFRSDSGGVIVDVPGEGPIRLQRNGEQGGVSASDVELDNEPITPDGDGQVTLSDGTTLSPIENPTPPGIVVGGLRGDLPWKWIFSAIAGLALISGLTGYLLHRRRPELTLSDDVLVANAGTEAISDTEFEHFLAELASDPDPARAVRLGFHAAEQGLGVMAPRRRSETPNEWAARIGQQQPRLRPSLSTVCDLFARARFGPGPVSGDERDEMIRRLRLLRSGGGTDDPSDTDRSDHDRGSVDGGSVDGGSADGGRVKGSGSDSGGGSAGALLAGEGFR